MNVLSLFTGAGGGELAFQHLLIGFRTIGYVEIEDYCQRIIAQRIKDGLLDNAPIFTDIKAFINSGCCELYKGIADVVTGGFPCQDISSCGRGAGIEGERSGLWSQMSEVVRQVKPRYVFVENSPMLTIRGLGTVLKDLAEMGYDAKWGCLSSSQKGANHRRRRFWLVANSAGEFRSKLFRRPNQKHRNMAKHIKIRPFIDRYLERLEIEGAKRPYQGENGLPSYLCDVSDSLAYELDELKAIGNGQDPFVAATAWEILKP